MPESGGRAPVLVPAGAEFEGVVVVPDPGRIEGRVRGEVVAEGAIWIGERGVVEADLDGDSIVVAGRVEGDVRARVRIELLPTARVDGSLEAPSLVLAEGSRVNGACRSGDAAARGCTGPGSP